MRAIAHRSPGPIDGEGSLVDVDLPDPVPGPGDLLVRVRAVSVNPADAKARAGLPLEQAKEWRVLGFDGAGEVVAVGGAVRDFHPGDRVFFVANGFDQGSNAELTLVDARMAARKPATLDWAEAAALPVAAGTAWEISFERMEVTQPVPGAAAAVLVVNGAGGVGSAAIQLLRARTDLTVIASASRPETQDWVKSLGAHHVVNHRQPMAPQVAALGIGRPGLILSTSHTDDHLVDLVELIAPQGRIGAIDDPKALDIVLLKDKSLSFHWEYLMTRSRHATPDVAKLGDLLGEVAALADAGRFRNIVTQRLTPISAARLAMKAAERVKAPAMSIHCMRLASAADVTAIQAIVGDAYGHYLERMGRMPAPMTADYAALVEDGVVWVVEVDREVAGLVVLRQAPDHLLISNLAVAPARQGLGLGRALLGHAEAHARLNGLAELRLYTHELMHENIALYTKLGWEEYDRAEHQGFQRVFMRRPLPPQICD